MDNPLIWGIIIVVGIPIIVIISLLVISYDENGRKEDYRCFECGFLSNRIGNEEGIIWSNFLKSTYKREEKELSNRLEHKVRRDNKGREERYTIRHTNLEITDICKKCGAVYQKFKQQKRQPLT